ncbi:MAG: ABC transporter transmembrane domain-containing protein, partial [Sphingomonas sp.]
MADDIPAETTPPAPAPAQPPRRIGNLLIVWSFTRRYPLQLIVATLALTISSLATLSISAMSQLIVDKGFAAGADHGQIGFYFKLMLGVATVLGLATAIRFYFVSWLGERTVADMRIAVQRNLLRLPPKWFEENRPSEISSRLTSDTAIVEQVVGSTVSIALRNLVTGIGGVIYLFWLSPKIAAFLIIGIPVTVLPIMWLGSRVRALSRRTQDSIATIGSVASETLGAMRIVQAFGQEQREAERFQDAVWRTFAAGKRRFALRAVMTALVMWLLFTAITLILWSAVGEVASGRITPGSLMAFVVTSAIVTGSFGAVTEVYGDLLRASGAASRLAELLHEEPDIAAPESPVAMPQPSQGAITFDNVRFRYPTRPEVSALKDFSLQINPGETVAVVGPSGAGKSTLFQLVQRFYDPESGEIRIDGVPLPAADPAEIRARMAMVPQE